MSSSPCSDAYFFHACECIRVGDRVAFVCNEQLRQRCKRLTEPFELAVDGDDVLDGVAPGHSGNINYVQKHAAALDMTQKCVPEPRSLARSLDKPGNVCGDKASAVMQADHTEIRREGCEMVFGYLWSCRRDDREDRGFSDARKTDKSDIGYHFKLEYDLALLTLESAFRKARRAACGRCKMAVAPAALASSAEHERLAVLGHIFYDQSALGVLYYGSGRNGKHGVLTVAAVKLRARAVFSVLRYELAAILVVEQGICPLVYRDNDVAAASAVAAVRSAV